MLLIIHQAEFLILSFRKRQILVASALEFDGVNVQFTIEVYILL